MKYANSELQEFITEAIQNENREPCFYAVGGSNLYGYNTPSSDIDIVGFHTVNPDEYSYLHTPKEEIQINMDGITDGFEEYSDVELRSYELKKFGKLLLQANFTVIELVCCGEPVLNKYPQETNDLNELVRDQLPLNVPHTYYGLAKSNYYRYLDRDKPDSYRPEPKRFLNVYRALLAADYVLRENDIVADLYELADYVPDSDEFILDELVDLREETPPRVRGSLENRAHDKIRDLLDRLDLPSSPDKAGFKDSIDVWMREVRSA